jgi:hypothetical protein
MHGMRQHGIIAQFVERANWIVVVHRFLHHLTR